MIYAACPTLPSGQLFELREFEIFAWASHDISCAFYVFELPGEWWHWFALDWPLPPELRGGSDTEPKYLCVAVIPMGWLSAVGIHIVSSLPRLVLVCRASLSYARIVLPRLMSFR